MSDPDVTFEDLAADIERYLHWQRRLGHAGLPAQLIMARRRETLEEPSDRVESEAPPQAGAKPKAAKPAPRRPAAAAVGPTAGELSESLAAILTELGDCRRCKLSDGRKTIVFGEGNPDADIMFIGEGPGADEDVQGRPFVGKAGQLLTRWIELGMGIPRSQVYIGNIVKCRPPKNRDPEPDEVEACIGFIRQQIAAVRPKVIVLLGRVPMTHLLGVKTGITRVHGNWYTLDGIPAIPIFHPSYCLRPPIKEKRKAVWEDIKKILTRLDMPIPQKGG